MWLYARKYAVHNKQTNVRIEMQPEWCSHKKPDTVESLVRELTGMFSNTMSGEAVRRIEREFIKRFKAVE